MRLETDLNDGLPDSEVVAGEGSGTLGIRVLQSVGCEAKRWYQPRRKAVGCTPWFDSPGFTYIAFCSFVDGLAVTA